MMTMDLAPLMGNPDRWKNLDPWWCGATLAAAAAAYYAVGFASKSKDRSKYPPHHHTIPILGDGMFMLIKHGGAYYRRLYEKYGPTYSINMFLERTITICRYEDVKALLAAEHELVEGEFPPSVRTLLGEQALAVTTAEAHLRLRKALAPIATAGAIRGYLPRVQQLMEGTLRGWLEQGEVQGYTDVKSLTFRIIMDVVIGFDPAYAQALGPTWLDFTAGLFSLPFRYPGSRYSKGLAAREQLRGDIAQLIRSKRQQRQQRQQEDGAGAEGRQAEAGARSALDLMLDLRDEHGLPLSDEQLKDNLLLLGFAGHDTTATAISHALNTLPQHPAVLARLRAEQQAVLAQHGEAITEAVLRESTYLDAVVKELLRHQTVIAGVFRRALKDFEVGGFAVRRGDKLLLQLRAVMELDSRWAGLPADSPLALDKFAPDRWLEGGKAARTGGWLPFGAGARMCLGYSLALAEIKVFIALMARHASWQVADPSEAWSHFPIAVPSKGLPLRVQALPA